MEKFEPYYNPWVGGGRPYSYAMQPEAAATNLGVAALGTAGTGLAGAFAALALHLLAAEEEEARNGGGGESRGGDGGGGRGGERMSRTDVLESLRRSTAESFGVTFQRRQAESCRVKLGLAAKQPVE